MGWAELKAAMKSGTACGSPRADRKRAGGLDLGESRLGGS